MASCLRWIWSVDVDCLRADRACRHAWASCYLVHPTVEVDEFQCERTANEGYLFMNATFRAQQSCCRRRLRLHWLVRLCFAHVKQFHLQCIVLRVNRLQVLFQLYEFLLDFVVLILFGDKFLVQLFDAFDFLLVLVLLLLVVVLPLLDFVGVLSLVIELVLFALTILFDRGIVVRVQTIEFLLHTLQA